MMRKFYTSALCGFLLLMAAPIQTAPVQAQALPVPAPITPSVFRPAISVAEIGAAIQQTGTLTATAAVTSTQPLSQAGPLSATLQLTPTAAVTTTTGVTASLTLTQETGVGLGLQSVLTDTSGGPDTALDAQYADVLEGTIIANRTEADVRFFVEGQVYDLAPLRSLGLPLPRATAVLNLFNCDAFLSAEGDAGCFWDPYLLKQDGFYEVVTGAETGALVNLSLREAGAPPANQIWVQNRTGERETIIVNNEMVEIAPSSVEQFTFADEGPIAVNLRNCITLGAQTACEWAPQAIERGYYYALVKLTTMGANNATVTTDKLNPVVASSGEVVAPAVEASCLLRVPTLNVRGGPGLEFPVIAKVRGTDTQPGSVVVVGFDASRQWMQVSDRIAAGGWVTANADFIICTGDIAALPVAGGGAAAELAATPEPVAAEAAPEVEAVAEVPIEPVVEPVVESVFEEAPVVEVAPVEEVAAAPVEPVTDEAVAEGEPTEEATAEATAEAVATVPSGLARIVVNNGFDQVVRFTLDQRYRVELDNLSGEWDLQPGQSISVLVYPGMVPFTVSTPWRGLSDNADVTVEADQERALWLYFIPDPDGSGNWILQF